MGKLMFRMSLIILLTMPLLIGAYFLEWLLTTFYWGKRDKEIGRSKW